MTSKDPFIQFQLIDGAAHEEGPLVGIFAEGASNGPARGRSPLYLLLEPSSPAGLPACNSAKDLLFEIFSSSKGSLTGRLRNCLRSLHEKVVEENSKGLGKQKFLLGAACVTVRGNDLYVAQSGPTLVYIINESGVTRVAPPAHLSSGALTALGASRELPVRLYKHHLTPGSVVLLASSTLEETVCSNEIFDFFREGMDEGVINIYRKMAGSKHLGILALAPTVDEVDESVLSAPSPPMSPELRYYSHVREDFEYRNASRTATEKRSDDQDQNLRIKLRQQPRLRGKYTAESLLGMASVLKVGALGLFIAIGLWFMWQEVTGREEAKFASLMAEARVLQQDAAQAASKDRSRQLLVESKITLQAALNIREDDSNALEMMDIAEERISQLDSILVLQESRLLTDFQSMGSGSPLIRNINIGNGKAYLLDKGRDQIYEVTLSGNTVEQGSGEPPIIVKDSRGTPRNLVHLFWMSKGTLWTRDSLMAFDERRKLLEYTSAGEVRELPVRGAEEWGGMQSVVSFGGNLYVLDPVQSQVWRYVPTDRGFDSERKGILSGVDLKGSVDMAIDGDIYVLLRTGEVVKYAEGRPETLSIDGLDRPVSNPSAMFGGSQTKFLYIVDRGNGRIIAIDRNGVLRYQLAVTGIQNLQDVYVDEVTNTIYIATDNKLYLGTIPNSDK